MAIHSRHLLQPPCRDDWLHRIRKLTASSPRGQSQDTSQYWRSRGYVHLSWHRLHRPERRRDRKATRPCTSPWSRRTEKRPHCSSKPARTGHAYVIYVRSSEYYLLTHIYASTLVESGRADRRAA